jgi:hypothetical protein
LTSTAKPPVPVGGRPGIAGTVSRRDALIHNPLMFDTMIERLAGPPVCRCAICAERRAARLTQALQNKFGSASALGSIR